MKNAVTAVFPFILSFVVLSAVRGLDESHPWVSFIYFYGLGLTVYIFFSWILIRLKAIDLSFRKERLWFVLLSVGLVFFFTVHAVWNYLAFYTPYKGG